MKRMIMLVVMAMAAIVVLSGPVASVLDLPEPTAEAKKKKKKPQTPRYVTIICPNRADGVSCVGTTGQDYLVGTNSPDFIQGRAGNDIYDSKGGSDYLLDNSTSDDYYYESVLDFGNLVIDDEGGTNILDLSRRYESDDFVPQRDGDDLFLNGPGSNNVRIVDYFDFNNTFFKFYFSDGYKTPDANDANTLQDASASEQAEAQKEVVTDSPAGEQISSDDDQNTTSPENTDS